MSTYAVAVKSWVCGWLAGAWERGVEVCVVAWDVRSYGGGEVEGWMGGCREGSCGCRGSKSLWLLYVSMCSCGSKSLCSPNAFLLLYLHMHLVLNRSSYIHICIYFLALRPAAQYSTAPAQDQLWILHTSSLDLVLSAPFGTTPWMCSFVVGGPQGPCLYVSVSMSIDIVTG